MNAPARTTSRHVFIDHLRVLLTALVILHHTAIEYGGSGGWYWRERPDGSSIVLLLFNAVNQSYFMGFFFLLAGYFTPASYERKGARTFLSDRFVRLGIPLLVYFFVLAPMTIALAKVSDGSSFFPTWLAMTRAHEFEPGPLWFAEALLVFALLYAAWRTWRPSGGPALARIPKFTTLLAAAIVVAFVSFVVRLAVPVGKNVLFLQLGYFPPYILLFAVGCMAARSQLLERISLADAKPWLVLSALMLVVLPVMVATRMNSGSFSGGLSINAAFYALWDPLVAWGIILGLLWFARSGWSGESRTMEAAARRAYGAYIVHPPVLVALSVLAHGWAAAALLKFAVIGAAAVLGSFGVASLLLLVPGSRRVL